MLILECFHVLLYSFVCFSACSHVLPPTPLPLVSLFWEGVVPGHPALQMFLQTELFHMQTPNQNQR